MAAWRAYRDATHPKVLKTYQILGFLSSGTYGRVYKACLRNSDDAGNSRSRVHTPVPKSPREEEDPDGSVFAIKKFKPDKDSDGPTYVGISQSAMREIGVSRWPGLAQ